MSGALCFFFYLKLLLAKFMQEDYTFHCSEKSDLRDSASELYSEGGRFGRRSVYRYPVLGFRCFLTTFKQLGEWYHKLGHDHVNVCQLINNCCNIILNRYQ